ncbi:hypothetical protein OG730_41240 (plasmid) [Streptomyces sp. NBC_01298]|uniref:hypothetical protein n=1 Tax=Streptomyces sp. NBC_01298 TaxID=2903817 RepID=UPI002E1682EE|nr:hypothetical protein OG730_41225 [Streptomyces sp. NBC_01298]WSK25896.1 hypothetical protein OG730_41240 [Streptomyces sp. NBC_01298]
MTTHETVTTAHVSAVLEQGGRFVLAREPDGSLAIVHDVFLQEGEYELVWSGDLSDLGDGWEWTEDEDGSLVLAEGEAELAARVLNEIP